MTDSLQFPRWMPSDAEQTLNNLYSVISSAGEFGRDVVIRLVERLEMEGAWKEHQKHFAQVIPFGDLVFLAFSTWLCAVYNQFASRVPNLPSDLQIGRRERELAVYARAVADEIRNIHPEIRADKGITDATLTEIERVAAFFEHEAQIRGASKRIAPPPHKKGYRRAQQVAFVNALCDARFWQPPLRRPYALVATLVNVVYNEPKDSPWDADKVMHCYRSRSRAKM